MRKSTVLRPTASRLRRLATAGAVAAVTFPLTPPAHGKTWINGSGSWFDASHWDDGLIPVTDPLANPPKDLVQITGPDVTVNVPPPPTDPALPPANALSLGVAAATLNVSGTFSLGAYGMGGGSLNILPGAQMFPNVAHIGEGNDTANVHHSGGLLFGEIHVGYTCPGIYNFTSGTVAGSLIVGSQSVGSFTQSGGLNNAATVVVGDSSAGVGGYNLSGGNVASTDLFVGNLGLGTFTQSAGTLANNQHFYVGVGVGGSGTVTLSGGTMNLTDIPNFTTSDVIIGDAGDGTFIHSGGDNFGADIIHLGVQASSHGTYHLSGSATLSTEVMEVGEAGTGTFLQEGASSLTVRELDLGTDNGTGTYTVHGGSLSATGGITVSTGDVGSHGTFTADGGSIVTGGLTVGLYGEGAVSISNTAQLTVNGDETVGQFGRGTLDQGAVSHTVSGGMTVGSAGHVTLNTGGTLAVGGTLLVSGANGSDTGLFDQLGGDVNAGQMINWGVYNLSAGTLRGPAQTVDSGGVLNWQGGQIGDASHGTTTVGNGTVVISGSGNRPLVNREFVNQGLVQWTGATDVLAQQGTTVQNGVQFVGAGVFEITNDRTFHNDAAVSPGFANYALVWKHAAGGVTLFDSSFVNDGTIQVDTGTIRVAGPLVARGTFYTGGPGTIEAASGGTFTVADPGGTTSAILDKDGSGTLLINATQSHVAGSRLQVNAGTAVFNTDAGPSGNRNLSVTVAPGAYVAFNATQHLDQVDVSGTAGLAAGRKVLSANSFRLNSSSPIGTFDVNDGAMAIHGGTSVSDVTDWLTSGYASRAWNGIGIDSTAAAANPANRSVGFALAGDVLGLSGSQAGNWLGESVEADTLLVRYTLPGDANLDGTVDFTDEARLAQHYNTVGGMHWYEGDFNFDGNVDFLDLAIMAQQYNTSLPPSGAAPVFATSAVPEPSATWALLCAGAAAAFRRRRRVARDPLAWQRQR